MIPTTGGKRGRMKRGEEQTWTNVELHVLGQVLTSLNSFESTLIEICMDLFCLIGKHEHLLGLGVLNSCLCHHWWVHGLVLVGLALNSMSEILSCCAESAFHVLQVTQCY